MRAKDFAVTDSNQQPIARLNKEWGGPKMFTDADTYVVHLEPGARDPLRSLALGASPAVDLIMKRKDY